MKELKKTWFNIKNDDIQILDYYGDHNTNEIINNSIYVVDKDIGQKEMYQKTLGAFEVAINNLQFDFLLRTNASTFIRPDLIYKILRRYSPNEFYGAAYAPSQGRITYPPGTSMIFSKDVVNNLVNMRYDDNPEAIIDDVGIGYLLRKKYSNFLDNFKVFERAEINNNYQFILNDPLFKIKFQNIWAFRCKSPDGERHLDIIKMNKIYKIFYD